MDAMLTDKQRRALEHVERARSAGMTLSGYARSQGFGVRAIYDSMVALRKKGVLAPATGDDRSAFVAVRVAPTMPSAATPAIHGTSPMCRLRMGALVIECAQWPPAAWVSSLLGSPADAAP
jgi:hypothetical protein